MSFKSSLLNILIIIYSIIMSDSTNELLNVAAIIGGLLILVYPNLVAYVIAIFLIVYGVLQIIK